MSVLSEDLFQSVLVQPVLDGADQLSVVSGFATPAMASRHLHQVCEVLDRSLAVNLTVGMTAGQGILTADHQGFCEMVAGGLGRGRFSCSYVTLDKTPVHSKVYVWSRAGTPVKAFAGSANYTQNAFFGRQRELVAECDPQLALRYYQSLVPDTVECTYDTVDEFVRIVSAKRGRPAGVADGHAEADSTGAELESVTCPLVQRDGEVHGTAGLNWGQRDGREPNQAYIPLRAEVSRTEFFPPRGTHFTVLTDDNKTFICTRAQDNGKAIETPASNSLLGEYFRNRLGLANGARVTTADLRAYGRTDVSFTKIDDETYLMDFSSSRG
ncbi:MAG: restriction endonuclease PLD domain-containing protein [Sulfobacillus sp.]